MVFAVNNNVDYLNSSKKFMCCRSLKFKPNLIKFQIKFGANVQIVNAAVEWRCKDLLNNNLMKAFQYCRFFAIFVNKRQLFAFKQEIKYIR